MKKNTFYLIFLIIMGVFPVFSQTKHALLIGINEYVQTSATPAAFVKERGDRGVKWSNLDGCVNDIKAINQIITSRYGFNKNNITTLFDRQATNKSIKQELENLAKIANKGDIVFFYYSGHGSQVNNSLSYDETGKDQTIVPSDLYDIRNKELSKYFNAILDKIGPTGKLTSIFDSCHSGAVARGNPTTIQAKSRDLPSVSFDFKDPTEYPKIEERGALILSAAQRDQLAKETSDENGNAHGAFTYALLKALITAPLTESAEKIFMRVNISLKSSNLSQDPVLGGTDQRKKNGLFGENTENLSGKIIVPILNILDVDDIVLAGGVELGLTEGTVLNKVNAKDTVLIKVTAILGIGRSKGELISGTLKQIKAGDFFEIKSIAMPNKPNLTVKIPVIELSFAELQNLITPFQELINNGYFTAVTNPIEEIPSVTILYENGQWKLNKSGNKNWETLPDLSQESLKKKISKNSNVLFQLPAFKDLASSLQFGPKTRNDAIALTNDSKKADYTLIGILKENEINYAWIKTEMMGSKAKSITPASTDFFKVSDQISNSITEYAIRLGKINAWANLPSPTQEEGTFPYSLALLSKKDNKIIEGSTTLYGGESISLILKADSNALENWDGVKRFCYVFAIDPKGKTSLLFPPKNLGNELMPKRNKPFKLIENLGVKSYTIGEPFGLDIYYLLTSEVQIQDPTVFEADGVKNRSANFNSNPLASLLENVGTKSRGIEESIPTNWSVQKLLLISEAK